MDILSHSITKLFLLGGPHSIIYSVLALHPAAPGLNPGVPKFFSEKEIVDVAEVN